MVHEGLSPEAGEHSVLGLILIRIQQQAGFISGSICNVEPCPI